MQVISVEEIITQKILPFDIYDENGDKLFLAGEVLTPGKLLQLRNCSLIYKDEDESDNDDIDFEESEESAQEDDFDDENSNDLEEEDAFRLDDLDDFLDEETAENENLSKIQNITEIKNIIETTIDLSIKEKEIQEISKDTFKFDEKKEVVDEDRLIKDHSIDEKEKDKSEIVFKINRKSQIAPRAQKTIQQVCKKAFGSISPRNTIENSKLYMDARDTLVEEVMPIVDRITYRSELKIPGEYDETHGTNVSLLSVMLAKKMDLNEYQIRDVALSAMLHDIGKTRVPKSILHKTTPGPSDIKLIQLHSQIGYKIITKEMDLPEYIAKVALEHHEKNDGSGYPYGLSGDLISLQTQIVSVCNMYDNLTANKAPIRVDNPKMAIKAMLEMGSRWFNPEVLYTFVHMANYNDNHNFD
ncbi:MAG: HD domain-containing protein [Candidatus Gastranaerophilales bacterium]|nr:HD domain-containing protein [Candidatus Gastranaerophilales bacterium]